jgi:hypothetical protein
VGHVGWGKTKLGWKRKWDIFGKKENVPECRANTLADRGAL